MSNLQLDIKIDPAAQAAITAALSALPIQMSQAASFALNRAMNTVRTAAKREIASELGLKQSALTQAHRFGATGSRSTGLALDVGKATPEKLEARLLVRGKRIPISFFNIVPTPITPHAPRRAFVDGQWRTVRRRGDGVSWTVGGHGATFNARAFIGRGRAGTAASAKEAASGHVAVFGRIPGTLKIFEFKGPSIPKVARDNPRVKRAITADGGAVFKKRLEYEIGRVMDRIKKK